MNITYSYEIASVDELSRCMEIIYSADGHTTMHIGARLPYQGESLEQIVRMYAPIAYWREQQMEVAAPAIGAIGSLTLEELEPPTPSYSDQRRLAYREVSDPVFFMWQRGEATQQQWLDKIEEIKAIYPEDGSGPVLPFIKVTEI